jgi:tungstate transport system substrate-binding protein
MKIVPSLATILLIITLYGCTGSPRGAASDQGTPKPEQAAKKGEITMATTTSTYDSGLLDYLNPMFTKETGIEVKVVSMGTGAAIRAGENGDADLILVHDPDGEKQFVAEGYGVDRREVFYNDFILLGPPGNPAGIVETDSANEAFSKIAASESTFISRGDDSGTHRREQSLWRDTGLVLEEKEDMIIKNGKEVPVRYIKPSGDWYLSIGQGMGAALNMAHEKGTYVLADRGTYLSYKADLDLVIANQGDASLVNQYGIIAVNPEKHPEIKFDLAMEYIDWICSDEGQKAIGAYEKEGEILFHPNYKAPQKL